MRVILLTGWLERITRQFLYCGYQWTTMGQVLPIDIVITRAISWAVIIILLLLLYTVIIIYCYIEY